MRRRRLIDHTRWLPNYGYETVEQMQREYNLPPTGIVDTATLNAMTVRRCGTAFRRRGQPGGQLSKLATNRPLVFFQGWLGDGYTKEWFETETIVGMNGWSVVCDIQFAQTKDIQKANIVVKTELIDAEGETLAYAFFPSGARMQLPLVFGLEEQWDKEWGVDLSATACHEGGHNMGIDHDPTGSGLMAAFYNPKVLWPASAWEIAEAQRRYGKPVSLPPPTPIPLPPNSGRSQIQITVEGRDMKVIGYKEVK